MIPVARANRLVQSSVTDVDRGLKLTGSIARRTIDVKPEGREHGWLVFAYAKTSAP